MAENIDVSAFGGMIPRISARMIKDQFAQTATNCDFRQGNLQAMASLGTPSDITASTTAFRSIYLHNGHWLRWTSTTISPVSGQVASSNHLLLYTGDGYPKQLDASVFNTAGVPDSLDDYQRLGVTPPTTALTITFAGSGDGVTTTTISYVYTYVDTFGATKAESAPNTATAAVTVEGGLYVKLTGFVKPTKAASGNNITHFRIYRVVSGISGAEYELVKVHPGTVGATAVWDVPSSTTDVYDANSTPDGLSTDLGEVLPSEDWDAPPDALTGLSIYQNGVLIGFTGREICPSEPFVHYAFPDNYRLTTHHDITALATAFGFAVVCTDEPTYVVEGTSPEALTLRVLPYSQTCVSAGGMIATEIGIIYPSPDGLVLIDPSTVAHILTKNIYTKEQWAALTPANLISFFWDGKYYGFFSGTATGIMYNFAEEPSVTGITLTGYTIYGGYVDPETDTLYLLIKDASDKYYIASFCGGTGDLTYVWKSKVFYNPNNINYSCGRVIGDFAGENSVSLKIYADGTLKQTVTVTTSNVFRLISGFRAKEWEFQLDGTIRVDAVKIARSPGVL